MFGESRRPVLVLEMPGERIRLASVPARQLLAPDGIRVIGRTLAEYTTEPAADAATLMARGHLNGYQSRLLTGRDPVDVWVRSVGDGGGGGPALAMLSPREPAARWAPDGTEPAPRMVVGSTDAQLMIDRLSDDIAAFLGYPPEDLLGRSLPGLVDGADVANLMFAVAQTAFGRGGVSLTVGLLRPDGGLLRSQLVLLPLAPAPAVAFALQPASTIPAEQRTAGDLRTMLVRFGQAIAAATAAAELTAYRSGLRPTLPELTGRELQIVNRLLAGDRVPAISQQLYLAQSTVRNHLSAVFAKLGVRSQQELIVLLRQAQTRSR